MGFLLDLKKGINVTNPGFMEQVLIYGRVWTPPLLQALCSIATEVRLPTCTRSL